MAGPSNLIAFGFGSWSSVGYLPTLGMGIGEAGAVDITMTTTIIEYDVDDFIVNALTSAASITSAVSGVNVATDTTLIESQ